MTTDTHPTIGAGGFAEEAAQFGGPDAIFDHGHGRRQQVVIERQYGVDAYLAILARDRARLADRVARLDLPPFAFEQSAGPRVEPVINAAALLPEVVCRVPWERRYGDGQPVGVSPVRPRRSWRRLFGRRFRGLLGMSTSTTDLAALLGTYESVAVWGQPSRRLQKALGMIPARRQVRFGPDGVLPGLRVPMHPVSAVAGRATVFVVSDDRDARPDSPAYGLAVGLGADRLLVVGEAEPSSIPASVRLPAVAELPEPKSWPRISVVTVSFQQARYLEACLRSVLDQNYPDLEYIVIDGGSTDGSREILERYRTRISTLVIEPDRGQSDALNKGLSRATGDVLTWVCSDDCLEPGSLFTVARAFAATGADIVAGGCRLLDERGHSDGIHHSGFVTGLTQPLSFGDLASFEGAWHKGLYFYQPEVFFTRDIWERAGRHVREDLFYVMDYELFLRFALAGARLHAVRHVLGCSRRHTAQKTRHDVPMYLPSVTRVLQDFAADFGALVDVQRRSTAACSDPPAET